MKRDRTERITEWDTRPFDGGYDGLGRLADAGFSGAVAEGTAWAMFVNGRIVGVFDGTLDAFDGADGTAYRAPEPAVALLFAMQETAGESRAQYYTEDTPISNVDQTLSDGGFTGYIELSENVLSGDYYVVYSGGKSTGVAFVGNNDTLHTGEEAFDRADDEVGIYEVYDVDLDIAELPETEPAPEADADATGVDEAAGPTTSEPGDGKSPDETSDTEPTRPESADPETVDESAAERQQTPPKKAEQSTEAEEPSGGSPSHASAASSDEADEIAEPAESETAAEPAESETAAEPAESETAAEPAESETTAEREEAEPRSSSVRADSDTDQPSDAVGQREGSTQDPDNVFSEEAAWRQTQTIPALDPEDTQRPQDESSRRQRPSDSGNRQDAITQRSDEARDRRRAGPRRSPSEQRTRMATETGEADSRESDDVDDSAASPSAEALQSRIEEIESALEEERRRKQALESKREALETERDQYRERAAELEERVGELESEVDRLRDQLEAADGAVSDAERTMEPAAAISGTNLFVRYGSKGKPTLEAVHAGEATREELSANLQLEHHTSFEESNVAVDGEPYREFLQDTVEYTFSRWIIEEFPFEIRETGNVDRLRDLYDAIPEVDRIEFDGTIAVSSTGGDGERENETFTFDIVFRDRMGDPLFVANLNDSRDPTTQSMVDTLVSDAVTVGEKHQEFAAALSVTASFFDPGALDAVGDATGGGLLSRSKRASFVKLSRKQGFHLCLVETREGGFHLNVPEL